MTCNYPSCRCRARIRFVDQLSAIVVVVMTAAAGLGTLHSKSLGFMGFAASVMVPFFIGGALTRSNWQ